MIISFFFFNDTATTEIYTLSLHDALPISLLQVVEPGQLSAAGVAARVVAQQVTDRVQGERLGHALGGLRAEDADRKSTRLNSSHANISYGGFCLKKKKNNKSLI